VLLGIDPGTRKCGYAVVRSALEPPLELGIVPAERLGETVEGLCERFPIRRVALGHGTNATTIGAVLAALGLAVTMVDERETTLLARRRYFAVHPPRGWKRFVPRGMLLPPGPIDDFAAALIAERLLALEAGQETL